MNRQKSRHIEWDKVLRVGACHALDEMTCVEGIDSDDTIDAVSKQEVIQLEVLVETLDILSDPVLRGMVEVLPE